MELNPITIGKLLDDAGVLYTKVSDQLGTTEIYILSNLDTVAPLWSPPSIAGLCITFQGNRINITASNADVKVPTISALINILK